MELNEKHITTGLYIAIIASFISCISDTLLLYAPGQDYLKGDYLFFKSISSSNMMYGHYLGVLFIPLQILALPWLNKYIIIESNKQKLIMSIVILYSIIMGCIYHASCAFMGIGFSDKLPNTEIIALYNSLYIPFALVFIIGLGYISYFVSYKILSSRTGFKRSLSAFVPINIAIVIYLIDYLTYIDMGVLTVSSFNLSILLFLICAVILKQRT